MRSINSDSTESKSLTPIEYCNEQPAEDITSSDEYTNEGMKEATDTLLNLLKLNDGEISTRSFHKKIEHIPGYLEISNLLRFAKNELFRHYGRTFFTLEKYDRVIAKPTTTRASNVLLEVESSQEKIDVETEYVIKKRKQEEARMLEYVREQLVNLYQEETHQDEEIVFDVKDKRSGGSHENVDLIAIHWRTQSLLELVTVEAKIDFTVTAASQAAYYTRFSHRVWLAVRVSSDIENAALELRETNPDLFDFIIDKGIGILACRRTQGSAYEVTPIQWPKKQVLEDLPKSNFIERYRDCFEMAQVIAPKFKKPNF